MFKEFEIDQYLFNSFSLPIDEKIPASSDRWQWFKELGFTSNFYVNNLECVFLILFGLLKSGLMQLIYKCSGWTYFKMKD